MKRKEAIIRYLAHVSRATRRQIAEQIKASPSSVFFKLTQLKHLVHNMKWSDGSKTWVLTPGATGDMIITSSEKKARSISNDRNGVMGYTRSTISKLIGTIPRS